MQKYESPRSRQFYENDRVSTGVNDLVFRGNVDKDVVQFNFMPRLIIAKFYRIRPWNWKERICVRLELFGCKYEVGMMQLPSGANTEFKKASELASGKRESYQGV